MLKINHICIQTNNYRESLDFYCSILGFRIINETRNFNNREYNTWIELNDFIIELQTSKDRKKLEDFISNSQGIVHFCFYTPNFDEIFETIHNTNCCKFKVKDGKKINNVGNNRLFKIVAPEGSIIEIRDTMHP